METVDEWIPEEDFSKFLELMPQVSVELIVEHDGGVLLAKRTSDPAKGEWFWPGGRLYKGETFTSAVHRLANQELGLDVTIQEFLGVQAQFWEEDSHREVDSRHTVNLVHLVQPTDKLEITLDDQHSDYQIVHELSPKHNKYVQKYVDKFNLL